ncbi:MAG: hypothetical protein HQL32_10340 [Planctomycetes bacterium]|nr:hypothetical protein [Planctomycetota bacterium]
MGRFLPMCVRLNEAKQWLNGKGVDLDYPPDLSSKKVSANVNSVANDSPNLIEENKDLFDLLD